MRTINLGVSFFVSPDTQVEFHAQAAPSHTIRVIGIEGVGHSAVSVHFFGDTPEEQVAAADRLIAVLTELRDDALAEARALELGDPVPA